LHVVQSDLVQAEGSYDVVTFRAVAPMARFLQDIGKSGVRWRTVVAYKGRNSRAREEIDDVRRSGETDYDYHIVTLEPPFLSEERCLIVASRSIDEKTIVDKPERAGYDFSEGDPAIEQFDDRH
jgi:16S rRNA G527 N7-methylase RsmG